MYPQIKLSQLRESRRGCIGRQQMRRELPRLLLAEAADLALVVKEVDGLQTEGHMLFPCLDTFGATSSIVYPTTSLRLRPSGTTTPACGTLTGSHTQVSLCRVHPRKELRSTMSIKVHGHLSPTTVARAALQSLRHQMNRDMAKDCISSSQKRSRPSTKIRP